MKSRGLFGPCPLNLEVRADADRGRRRHRRGNGPPTVSGFSAITVLSTRQEIAHLIGARRIGRLEGERAAFADVVIRTVFLLIGGADADEVALVLRPRPLYLEARAARDLRRENRASPDTASSLDRAFDAASDRDCWR